MTREEVIKLLEHISIAYTPTDAYGDYDDPQPYEEAIDMAIEALSKPNYESDNEVRLAVTDRNKDKVVLWDAFGEVEYYPCDTSEPKFYDEDDYWNGRAPTHDRLINASWVINEIHKNVCDMCEQGIDIEDCDDCKIEKIKRIIYSAPTVQADRPHGVWEYTDVTTDTDTYSEWVCSECGGSGYELMDFCPWCGAKMMTKGGAEEVERG